MDRNGGARGNGAGMDDMDEMERGTENWREWGEEEIRADVDRRTSAPEIDRIHQWGRYSPPYPGRREMRERFRMQRGTEDWRDWGEDEIRADLNRRTRAQEIDRVHQWGRYGRPSPRSREDWRQSWRWGSAYGGPGESGPYGGERRAGWRGMRRFGTGQEAPPPGVPPYGGYGGYGGGRYGGSYGGGMGPGPAGSYQPAGAPGGVSGTGSLAGGFGLRSGWEEPETWRRRRGRGRRFRRWEQEGPLVGDLMTRDPRIVGPEASAMDAARVMREEDAGIIPVCQDGRVLGVVTDRDLTVRVLGEGRDPRDTRVSEVMSGDVRVCTPDDRLVDAIRIMGEESVRRLPVVDRHDRILGILSMTDIAREAEVDFALQEALGRVASRRSFWSRW